MSGTIKLDQVSKCFRLARQKPFLAKQLFQRLLQRPSSVDRLWALKDVSLQVGPGEAVGVIGANGSGKSTLLSLVAGTAYATEGYVTVTGRIGPLLELGAGFHPDLTGYENIFLNASLLGMRRQDVERQLDSIVEFSGVGEFIDTPIQTYSTGMAARLGFAVIAHSQPEILLVDEALSVGDAQVRIRCEETIQRFLANGTTLLLVSHDLLTIERVCQRVVWLDHGRVRDQGPTRDILAGYHSFVAGTG